MNISGDDEIKDELSCSLSAQKSYQVKHIFLNNTLQYLTLLLLDDLCIL